MTVASGAKVFMFAGQGSQYRRMCHRLYEAHPIFRGWMDYGSHLAEAWLGISLVDLLFRSDRPPGEHFDRTAHTHPAIFLINYGIAQVLIHEGIRPDVLLGYSLGEMVALSVGGAVPLAQSLELVTETARMIEERTPPASMLAVLADPRPLREAGILEDATLACRNLPNHFVLSGDRAQLERIRDALSGRDIASQLLPVNHGFHSARLDPIRDEFMDCFRRVSLARFRLPTVSSLRGRTLLDADLTPEYGWQVLREPVRFDLAIRWIEGQYPGARYIDSGPSGTLAGFVRHLLGKSERHRAAWVCNPLGDDLAGLERIKATLA